MADLNQSIAMGYFKEALKKVFFIVNLMRQADYSTEDALNFLLLDLEALNRAYQPVAEMIDDMI